MAKGKKTTAIPYQLFPDNPRVITEDEFLRLGERLNKELSPKGVAVVLTAQHLCMAMRGVKKHDTWTTTSKMIGAFKDDLNCRQEFLKLIQT